jgi:hypothetical protein
LNPIRRGNNDFLDLCFGVSLFLSEDEGSHPVSGDSALHKDHQSIQPSDPLAPESHTVNVKLYNVSFLWHRQKAKVTVNHESRKNGSHEKNRTDLPPFALGG